VPLLNAMNKPRQYLAALTIGMTISGMMYAAPGAVEYFQSGNWSSIAGSMDGPAAYVEPAREFIGLLMKLVLGAKSATDTCSRKANRFLIFFIQ